MLELLFAVGGNTYMLLGPETLVLNYKTSIQN